MSNREQKLEAALRTVLDNVDYTVHACGLTDMVGACLPAKVIDNAREALNCTDKLEAKLDKDRLKVVLNMSQLTPNEMQEAMIMLKELAYLWFRSEDFKN